MSTFLLRFYLTYLSWFLFPAVSCSLLTVWVVRLRMINYLSSVTKRGAAASPRSHFWRAPCVVGEGGGGERYLDLKKYRKKTKWRARVETLCWAQFYNRTLWIYDMYLIWRNICIVPATVSVLFFTALCKCATAWGGKINLKVTFS